MERIYLDHAAATPLHPDVLDAMTKAMRDAYGNPSSVHHFGRDAKLVIDRARSAIAGALGCVPGEIVFTSGGTESDNLAILGTVRAGAKDKPHVVTSRIEHHAVLHACRQLEAEGAEVTYVPVDRHGFVHPEDVASAMRPNTVLVSIMFGNNEVGSIQPIAEIGRIAKQAGALMHVDAVQAFGLLPIRVDELPVDLLSVSSHKINGPKGVGALFVRRNVKLNALTHGGSQERNRRAGTENTAGIAGFAKAVELGCSTPEAIAEKARAYAALRDYFLAGLRRELNGQGYVVNTDLERSLPHIVNVSFPGIATETMLMNLDLEGIAAASGSACSSGSLEPSHVLTAMCLEEPVAASAVRFSFGFGTTESMLDEAAEKIATIVNRLSY